MARWTQTPAQRFVEKVAVNPDTLCWEWQAATRSGGYGVFWDGSRHVPSHRWSYMHISGPIPEEYELDHLCRNPRCCNPLHLEAVTHWENQRRGDGPYALNAAKEYCKRGHILDDKNVWISKKGHRYCRPCAALYQRERRAHANS